MKYTNYQQTTIYTCGASCILTAYNEFYGIELSKKNEMLIWNFVKNPIKWIGSMPAKILKFLSLLHPNSIFFFPQKFNFKKIHIALRWAYIILIKFHEKTAIKKLIKEQYNINKYNTNSNINLETMLNYILKNNNIRIIFAIVKNRIELHYLLIRAYKNSIYVMDAREKNNLIFSKSEFLNKYTKIDFGCYIKFEKE